MSFLAPFTNVKKYLEKTVGGGTLVNKIPPTKVALKTQNRFTRNTLYFFYSFKHAGILLPSYIFCMYLTDNW